MEGFSDRVAVVLGGSGGIGSAVCRQLRGRGARVASVSRRAADEADLTATADVGDEGQLLTAFETVQRELGPPTLLVCSAGSVAETPLEKMTLVEWQQVVDASLTGAFLAMRSVVPGMREGGGGAIVAISSGYARKGYRNGAHYAAAKGGLEALVKSVALETAAAGIRANAVAPGPIETPMIDHMSDERVAAVKGAIPQGRIGTADEVADSVLFLLSPAASHITGQVLGVNGGLLMA